MVNDALAEDFFWIGKVEVQFCCFNKVIRMTLALRMLKFQVCRCVRWHVSGKYLRAVRGESISAGGKWLPIKTGG